MLNDPSRGLPHHWTVVGDSESRRTASFCAAVERLGGTTHRSIAYPDVVDGDLPEHLPAECWVRLDSPGAGVEATRRLLRAGVAPMEAAGRIPISAEVIDRISWGRGEIQHPQQWFLGFSRVLQQLDCAWTGSGVHWMSTPQSVIDAFDKLECLRRWEAMSLPVAHRWDGIRTYHQLRATIPDRHARVFVKLRYGYSAMGAVALEWRDDKVRAITTVESTWSGGRPRLFVTKRPRVLHREFEIAWLIDTLAMEGLIVEEWLPKARWCGRSFDLRIVCIGGKPAHVVGRASDSPFTNLNLDAERIPRESVAAIMGDSWFDVMTLASNAAAALPDAFALGIDVLIRPGCRRFALLEANAFGDYLPGLQFNGRSIYEAEIEAFLAKASVYRELAT